MELQRHNDDYFGTPGAHPRLTEIHATPMSAAERARRASLSIGNEGKTRTPCTQRPGPTL